MSTKIYRIQDRAGRGPYKPGFSHTWIDPDRDGSQHPSFMEEFGINVVSKALYGQHVGCGFRSIAQLKAWFSGNELNRLFACGYEMVSMDADNILGESEKQLVFARNKPLREGAKKILILRAAQNAEGSREAVSVVNQNPKPKCLTISPT